MLLYWLFLGNNIQIAIKKRKPIKKENKESLCDKTLTTTTTQKSKNLKIEEEKEIGIFKSNRSHKSIAFFGSCWENV